MNPDHQQRGMSRKHIMIMLLCCLIPIVAIVLIRVFGIPLNSIVYTGLLLLCPLLHILMMRGMGKNESRSEKESNVIEGEVVSRSSETQG